MANIGSRDSPEAFLVDYFREPGEATVVPATPAVRVPMIPLLHAPHDWQVLDATAGMYSTRYCVQYSCMGLYRRYLAALGGGKGEWFGAAHRRWPDRRAGDGAQSGRHLPGRRLRALLFCGRLARPDGGRHATGRCVGQHRSCRAVVCVEDEEKRALFEGLGFRDAGAAADFVLDRRAVGAVRMVVA